MTKDLSHYQQAFLAALRAGDEQAAGEIVSEARMTGIDANHIYYLIFAPSMVAIGKLWEQNEISVAEEHLATAITERLIAHLSPFFTHSDHPGHEGRVMLGCVEGERHALGLRMLADLFREQGWHVMYLGADVPSDDWVRLVISHQPNAVAISAADTRRVPGVKALIHDLRAALPDLLVVVGGAAFSRNQELWRDVGATFFHQNPTTVVATLTARYARQVPSEHLGEAMFLR
jgi:MerR family transcriptional regulator, light-induced transcriptional regulator